MYVSYMSVLSKMDGYQLYVKYFASTSGGYKRNVQITTT